MRIIECVPNISEGRDKNKINAIADTVRAVPGVALLDVDPGASTNRTVITFAGEPEAVAEAAFQLIRKAAELIDMRTHRGEHPRQGATDVCPLIPVRGVTMDECVALSRTLARRVGEELGIPVYLYEEAATREERRNLANCRKGEYEALDKITTEAWKPDFGPGQVTDAVRRSGITTIGARDFLVAYNINLNTTSTRRANSIAFDIREAGRVLREGDPVTGKPILDEHGEQVRIPGSLRAVKGIGWFIEEYGIAQLSLNLTNLKVTPVHVAFEEACRKAEERGIRVTGSELVGLIPLQSLLDAADHFLRRQHRSLGIPEKEKIHIAVRSLGLDDLAPFRPEEKIIEYRMEAMLGSGRRLADQSLSEFAASTSSESPAPGGGSVSAYVGALGASLGAMVANLSSHKRGWDSRWEEFSDWAVRGIALQKELIALTDEDTRAFNRIMEAFALPKTTEPEKAARAEAIESASHYAMEVPLRTAEAALSAMELAEAMVREGNPSSVTDAAVGALCLRSAVLGAAMNVRINATGIRDRAFADRMIARVSELEAKAEEMEARIRSQVNASLAG